MNLYKVARLKLKENRWRPPDRTEHVICIFADRMVEAGGMLNFWAGDELVASFHAQWWTAAAHVRPENEVKAILDELTKSDDYYPTL